MKITIATKIEFEFELNEEFPRFLCDINDSNCCFDSSSATDEEIKEFDDFWENKLPQMIQDKLGSEIKIHTDSIEIF